MRIWARYRDVIVANWHHGFTCFGGPAVQFQTVKQNPYGSVTRADRIKFHDKFVDRLGWIDESMVSTSLSLILCDSLTGQYQQIFCLSQSLPGSASVKMLFCINSIYSDMIAGMIATGLFW